MQNESEKFFLLHAKPTKELKTEQQHIHKYYIYIYIYQSITILFQFILYINIRLNLSFLSTIKTAIEDMAQ